MSVDETFSVLTTLNSLIKDWVTIEWGQERIKYYLLFNLSSLKDGFYIFSTDNSNEKRIKMVRVVINLFPNYHNGLIRFFYGNKNGMWLFFIEIGKKYILRDLSATSN